MREYTFMVYMRSPTELFYALREVRATTRAKATAKVAAEKWYEGWTHTATVPQGSWDRLCDRYDSWPPIEEVVKL